MSASHSSGMWAAGSFRKQNTNGQNGRRRQTACDGLMPFSRNILHRLTMDGLLQPKDHRHLAQPGADQRCSFRENIHRLSGPVSGRVLR